MADVRNIVVIGGSVAGLGAAHYFLKHTYPELKKSHPTIPYKVHLVEPSSHYWFRISAPRALVSVPDMPHEKTFLSIAEGFKPYNSKDYELHQAAATGVDTSNRTVTVSDTESGRSETIPYYSLVIATGTSTPTALTSLHGSHNNSISALDKMNKRLPTTKSIVIGGGGPVAVETAGEIGDMLNGSAGWFKSRPDSPKAKITLITAGDKLLPVLSKGASDKAEKFLKRVGVDVVYHTRVEKAELSAADREIIGNEGAATFGTSTSDKSIIHLSNGETMEADLYIPAIGARPNTSFLPKAILDDKGLVKVDKQMRVEGAGSRVYCAGDVGNYSAGGMMSIFAAVPVLGANLAKDLTTEDSKETKASKTKDKVFGFKSDQSQFVPVGRSKGVGQFGGNTIPSVMVWAVKGRDYMVWNAKQMQSGSKW